MSSVSRPLRSVLYIPGSKARALEKAKTLPADAIIFDLEDAVAPDEKTAARSLLAETLTQGAYGARTILLRVNGLDTPWGADDLAAAKGMAVDAVLLPKVNGPADIDAAKDIASDNRFWAMVETAEGVLNAQAIAAHSDLDGFVLGTNDLAKELGCEPGTDRLPLMTSLQMSLLAARAAEISCIDGVFNAFKDEAGLEAECAAGRAMGMDGKTLIHPAQIEIANRAFAPSSEDIDHANKVIAAHEAALEAGEGVAVLDGRIVENLHVESAQKTLARAQAIKSMGGGS
ncbi:MAG: CoA ester lyase [Pseudomonadota bacterium]